MRGQDEHGGFYDHVPTPLSAPAPDDIPSYPDAFNFTRVGLRIPTLLVSPWIRRGTVLSAPTAAQKPYADSQFELTSIAASLKHMFSLPAFLTRRDAWAATFDDQLRALAAPRTDCPLHLPAAPGTLSAAQAAWEAARPLNDLQENFVALLAHLNGVPAPPAAVQGDVSAWVLAQTQAFLARGA